MKKIKVSYVYYVSDRDGVSEIEKGELNVSKFDLKECVEEYYKNDESYEYCEEMYDMYKSEKGDVMVVCDNGECYDNFVFVKK